MRIVFPTCENRLGFGPLAPEGCWRELEELGAMAVGAVAEGGDGAPEASAVSLLTARLEGGAMELKWIFTAPEYRLLGFGGRLLSALREAASQDEGISELEAFFPGGSAYDDLHAFLIAEGADIEDISEAGVYETTIGELRSNRLPGGAMQGVMPLDETPEVYLKAYAAKAGRGALPELRHCHPCSRAYVKDGRVSGLVLLSPRGDGNGAALVHCSGGKNAPAVWGAMLGSMLAGLCAMYGDNALLTIATMDKMSASIAAVLGAKDRRIKLYRASLGG